MKKLCLLAMALMVLGVTGCNTMAGLGQDTKAAGQAIENAATKK
ncbi:entericidin [Pandoraea terrae]|uniref:Entericidin n=1 Tax=Pandoraea terrae TaxID=1537710 RepID=A0A5E4VWT8_9BURK|nr:entericidin A/B family lipoprotein [Pandoraea terrae]VVE15986.1 entericidin [Pandoraea terrae]